MAHSEKIVKKLKKYVYAKKLSPEKARENYESFFTDKTLPNEVDLRVCTVATQNVFVFKPVVTNTLHCVLYFSGGFFHFGSQKTYSSLCASLSNVCQAQVFLPSIAYSSEKQFPFQLEQAFDVYNALVESLPAHTNFVFAGDGSGAGLALSLTLYLKEKQKPLPIGLALISPFVDFQIKKQKTRDTLLTSELLQAYALAYIGEENPDNYLVSPVKADTTIFKTFPPLFIQACRDELLFEQSVQLQDTVISGGGTCVLESFSDVWHFFQAYPDHCAQSHTAVEHFGKRILQFFSPPE